MAGLLLAGISAQAQDTNAVQLRMNWKVGQHFVQTMRTEQETAMNSPSFPEAVTQQMSQRVAMDVRVLKALPEGGKLIRVTFDEMALQLQAGEQQLIYDSADPARNNSDAVAETMDYMVNKSMKVEVDAAGKSVAVFGLEGFVQGMAGDNPYARQMLSRMFNEKTLEKMFSKNVGCPWLPAEPVCIGDEWEYDETVETGAAGVLGMKYTYSFSGWEQVAHARCAVISFTGTFELKPGGGMPEAMTIEYADIDGKLYFDVALGNLVMSEQEQHMAMRMQLPNPQGGDPVPMDTLMKQHLVLEMKLVE